jgi:hypothetical protein
MYLVPVVGGPFAFQGQPNNPRKMLAARRLIALNAFVLEDARRTVESQVQGIPEPLP